MGIYEELVARGLIAQVTDNKKADQNRQRRTNANENVRSHSRNAAVLTSLRAEDTSRKTSKKNTSQNRYYVKLSHISYKFHIKPPFELTFPQSYHIHRTDAS